MARLIALACIVLGSASTCGWFALTARTAILDTAPALTLLWAGVSVALIYLGVRWFVAWQLLRLERAQAE